MKLTFSSLLLKIEFLIVTLASCAGSSIYAQPPGSSLLSPGPVRPDGLDYRTEVPQGYLEVYSATDEFDDGGVPYYPHSSYAIYTLDGKLVKTVANHVSNGDETPDLVSLPVGPSLIEAQSEKEGFLRVHILIRAGARTALNLEGERTDTQRQLAKVRHSRHLAKR
jgi:hypothetical protein